MPAQSLDVAASTAAIPPEPAFETNPATALPSVSGCPTRPHANDQLARPDGADGVARHHAHSRSHTTAAALPQKRRSHADGGSVAAQPQKRRSPWAQRDAATSSAGARSVEEGGTTTKREVTRHRGRRHYPRGEVIPAAAHIPELIGDERTCYGRTSAACLCHSPCPACFPSPPSLSCAFLNPCWLVLAPSIFSPRSVEAARGESLQQTCHPDSFAFAAHQSYGRTSIWHLASCTYLINLELALRIFLLAVMFSLRAAVAVIGAEPRSNCTIWRCLIR